MIKILVADDHALFRGGLKLLIESQPDMSVAMEVGTGGEAVQQCRKNDFDIVLLDINLPDIDGIEVTRRMCEAVPGIRIIILTMYENPQYAARAIKAGASGYAIKGINPEELPDAIRKVAAGSRYISPSISEELAFLMHGGDPEDPVSKLSDRELYVVKKLSTGMTVKEISEDICLSPRTVETYKNRAMSKLGVRNSLELVHLITRSGLAD